MTPTQFVEELKNLEFENTFNPYSDQCDAHDFDSAADCRSQLLQEMLEVAIEQPVNSIWIGRDLGYRGGRRTGLAFTDDVHIQVHAKRWQLSSSINRFTKGKAVTERTATVIWDMLSLIQESVFLWNVFPLHPHETDNPFSNRSHNAGERRVGEELLSELITMLEPQRLIAVGNNATRTVYHLCGEHEVIPVRHPSYGGQSTFLEQISKLYQLPEIFKSPYTRRQ